MAKGIKTGGREVGTPNKISKEIRLSLKQVVDDEIAGLPALLAELPAQKRVEYLLRLMPFVLPQVGTIQGNYDCIMDWHM